MLTYSEFSSALEGSAAIRRIATLQPIGGRGDKIFRRLTRAKNKMTPRGMSLSEGRLEGIERICVLIDSVQSQANRLEEALLEAAEAERIRLPRLVVDFPKRRA